MFPLQTCAIEPAVQFAAASVGPRGPLNAAQLLQAAAAEVFVLEPRGQ